MGLLKQLIRISYPFINANKLSDLSVYPYYHVVSDRHIPHISGLYSYPNVKTFRAQIEFLLDNYKPIDPFDFYDLHMSNLDTNNKFLISFDDGLSPIIQDVIPILNDYKIKAIFYLNTRYLDNKELFIQHKVSLLKHFMKLDDIRLSDYNFSYTLNKVDGNINEVFSNQKQIESLLDKYQSDIQNYFIEERPYLTTAEVEAIAQQGHAIGGHSHSHYPFNRLTYPYILKEFNQCMDNLKNITKIYPKYFSFPFSDKHLSDAYFNKLTAQFDSVIFMGNSLKKRNSNNFLQRLSFEKFDSNTNLKREIKINSIHKNLVNLI